MSNELQESFSDIIYFLHLVDYINFIETFKWETAILTYINQYKCYNVHF